MGMSCIEMVEDCVERHRDADSLKIHGGENEMHPQAPSLERYEEILIEEGMRCTSCRPRISKKLRSDCVGCGDEWVKEDYEVSVTGNDVKALFPNIQSKSTGKVIREEVERSPLCGICVLKV